jgi:hypothetical protein
MTVNEFMAKHHIDRRTHGATQSEVLSVTLGAQHAVSKFELARLGPREVKQTEYLALKQMFKILEDTLLKAWLDLDEVQL